MLTVVLLPSLAQALGFGAPVLKSHLNEPLRVLLPLELNDQEDISRVFVELASDRDYRQLGLQVYGDRSAIRVDLEQDSAAHPLVALDSRTAINQPVLSILLKARIGHSTYFKHFQLMLDPVDSQATGIQLATTVVNTQTHASSAPKTTWPEQNKRGDWARTGRYGPVRGGDSLSEIAYRLRKDKRYTNRQVMLALFEANPKAFIQGDINRLKSRAWLQVPSADAVAKYSGHAAARRLQQLLRSAAPSSKVKKPVVDRQSHVQQALSRPELHFAGQIDLSDRDVRDAAATANRKRREAMLHEQFDRLHGEAMAAQLRLDRMDQSLQRIEGYIQQLQSDIRELQQRPIVSEASTDPAWFIAFMVLLLLNAGIVLGVFYQRRVKQAWPMYSSAKGDKVGETDTLSKANASRSASRSEDMSGRNTATDTLAQADVVPIDERGPHMHTGSEVSQTDTLIHQIEEDIYGMRLADAEAKLDKLEVLSSGNLRAAAMRVELLHKSDRFDERNRLIESMHDQLHEKKWLLFSRILDANVWQSWQQGLDAVVDRERQEAAEVVQLPVLDALEIHASDGVDLCEINPETNEPDEHLYGDEASADIAAQLLEDPFGKTVVINTNKSSSS